MGKLVAQITVCVVAVVGMMVIVAPLWFILAIYHGWALSILWGWFAVEGLHAPALSIPAAAGISLLVTFFTRQVDSTDKIKDEYKKESSTASTVGQMVAGVILPLIYLLMGWIIHNFMPHVAR